MVAYPTKFLPTNHVIVILTLVVMALCTDKELRLLGLQPMTGKAWPGGGACVLPVQMAVEGINAHPDLLNGYKLTYEYVDHECIAGTAVYKMTDMLNSRPPYVMLMGPILSTMSTATAQVSHHWNITQLAFAASSPVLSDRKRFPRFYRLSPPDRKMNGARIGLMETFNWAKISTIHHAVEFFSMLMDDFVDDVMRSNISVVSQQVFLHDPITQIQNLKDHDAKIIFTAMYEDRARAVLCAAYKVGLYGTRIVWLFMGYYSKYFWQIKLENVDCTKEEMAKAAEGMFLIKYTDQNPKEERGIANVTYTEFKEKMHNHPDYKPDKITYENLSDNCFDGTWLTGMALNCTVDRLQAMGHPKTLDQFTYKDTDINDIIFDCLGKSSVLGVSGKMFFPDGGDPDGIVKMERVQNNDRVLLGYYKNDKIPNYFEWIDDALKWHDGIIPRDSTHIYEKEVVLPTYLYATVCSLSTCGIVLAILFFTFNVICRNNRTVKLSSPNINNVLLAGCIMCYLCVFIKSIEVASAFVCQVRVFCFSLGFTLVFGALFSKTWRVYRIFTNKKLLRRSIKDSQLFAVIGILFALILMILVIWEGVAPHKVVFRVLVKEIYTNHNDDEVRPFVRVCTSNSSLYFNWAIYVMEGALLTFGAFLAWETRQVKIAALNDSHQIGICLYNVVVLSAVGLTLSLLLDQQEVTLYGVTSGCLIIGTTLTQMLVFLPKIYAVYNKVDMDTTGLPGGTSSQVPSTNTVSKSKFPESTA